MARDISFLTKDLEDHILKAKKSAAAEIAYKLQFFAPWWTGSSAKSWKISTTPVQTTKVVTKRVGKFRIELGSKVGGPVPKPTARIPVKKKSVFTSLAQPVYIGNEINYAGFTINNKNAKIPVNGLGIIAYEDVGRTAKSPLTFTYTPQWYRIYTKNKVILSDINIAFIGTSKRFTSNMPSVYG